MIAMYRKKQTWLGAASAAIAYAALGCGPTDPATLVTDPGPLTKAFAVSDHFVPSGFMGDGEYIGNVVMDVNNQYCKDRPPGAQGYCYRFTYYEGVVDWAGVFWVHPANNWGTRPGRAIDGKNFKQVRFKVATNYNLCEMQTANAAKKAEYLSQHAVDDPSGFNFVPPNPWYLDVNVFAGGISGANPGSCVMLPGYDYSDCKFDQAQGGLAAYKSQSNVPATTEWSSMSLNIAVAGDPSVGTTDDKTGWPADYDHIIGAFGWSIEYPAQPGRNAPLTNPIYGPFGPQGSWRGSGKPLEIYIDDIVWDTEPVVPAGQPLSVHDQRLSALGTPPICPAIIPVAATPDAGTPVSPIADSGTPDADN
jgi:hypothetical protein